MQTVQDLIDRLDLAPHPEGGFYRETFRSDVTDAEGRAAGTAILYLLAGNDVSRFHRIDADETWFFHHGAPLTIYSLKDRGGWRSDRLSETSPQVTIPAGVWFGAALEGPKTYALVSCTVMPAFEFSGFELAERDALLKGWPDAADWIKRLT